MPDFGIGEVAAATAASSAAAAGTAGAATATAAAAPTFLGLSAAAWSSIGALTSLLGVFGGTKGGVQAAQGQANIAELEAKAARDKAAFDATQYERSANLTIAKGVATAAASGVDVSSGSPLFNELDNVKQAAIAKQNIINTGEYQGLSLDYQARLARAGIPGIITSGIGQAGSVLSSWMGTRQYLSQLRTT